MKKTMGAHSDLHFQKTPIPDVADPKVKPQYIMPKETVSYSDAIKEIEEILGKIEDQELDVDDLTEKVKRVSLLIKLCREKLSNTEQAVEKILEDIQDK